jgi:hypothetical protein
MATFFMPASEFLLYRFPAAPVEGFGALPAEWKSPAQPGFWAIRSGGVREQGA